MPPFLVYAAAAANAAMDALEQRSELVLTLHMYVESSTHVRHNLNDLGNLNDCTAA